ncbi:MAG: ELWxxDGT repeat protein, partial [Ginsengibacter sp.]
MKKKLLLLIFIATTACNITAQVTQVNNNNSLHGLIPLPNGKTVFYSDIDSSIWASDGTPGNTIQISTIKYEDNYGYLNGKIYFSGSTAATGTELYVTDGTAGGTSLVKDINAGSADSDPGDMTLFNGFLYFSAVTAAQGRELWKSDGTAGGTSLLKDIVAGTGSSNGSEDSFHLFSNGAFLLFSAESSGSGVELWKSDGTAGGTSLLKDINTGADSSNPREFISVNSTILFFATDATHGEELWKTDGSAGGTVLVKDINPGTGSSTGIELFPGFTESVYLGFHVFNNKAYFNAYDGTSSNEIWGTDGTAGNTTLIKDFGGMAFTAFPLVVDAVNYPSKFIFPFADGST